MEKFFNKHFCIHIILFNKAMFLHLLLVVYLINLNLSLLVTNFKKSYSHINKITIYTYTIRDVYWTDQADNWLNGLAYWISILLIL